MQHKIHISQIPDISLMSLGQRYLPNFELSSEGFLLTSDPNMQEEVFILFEEGGFSWVISEEYSANPPLFDRPFIHKHFDCYIFAKDYYLQTFGVELLDVSYEDDWWNTGKNLYIENAKNAGFELLSPNEKVKIGDLFALRMRSSVVNHVAVYVGGGQIAHHGGGDVSKIEKLRPAHWRFSEGIYRHVSLS